MKIIESTNNKFLFGMVGTAGEINNKVREFLGKPKRERVDTYGN